MAQTKFKEDELPVEIGSPTLVQDEPVIPTSRLVLVITSICFGLFLSMIDTSIVATALYTIGGDLHSQTNSTWIALAYTLSYVGCTVIFASVGDVIGRRNAFVTAFIIFIGASLGCGFCQSLNQLIACRVLQGVGGSGLYSLTMVIMSEVSPPKMRAWIGGIVGIVLSFSSVLGPVLGGIITYYTTWRWIFWMNAPIGIVPLVVFCLAWPKPNQIRHAERRHFRELDLVGCALLIAASVLVVFAFQEGGLSVNAWGSAIFTAPLVIGCVCWILLFGWEAVVARQWQHSMAAIFPLRLMKRRVYVAGVLCTLLSGFPYFLVIFSLPLRFQVVNDKSALLAGIGLLPMLGCTAVGSTLGGALNSKKNRAFQTLFVAATLMLIGSCLLSTLSNTGAVEPKTYGFQVFIGLGFGLTVSTVSILGSAESELRDNAVAQGIVAQVRVLGGSIGIAASTAILGVTQRRELTGLVSPSQLASLQAAAPTLTPAQLLAVKQAYSDAFDESLKVCALVMAVCVVVTLGTFQRKPMRVDERMVQRVVEQRDYLATRGLVEKA
ncbi:hypothetical protein MMC26_006636 [Xylographa opegraphella]|nr:hypothetical protein [Xylographa opegraphella]